jgi:glutamate--cysteine ligase
MVKTWTRDEREALRNDVPKGGLKTAFRSTMVLELARQALRISRLGLKNRKRINARSQDESIYLAPTEVIAGNALTVSDQLLARYYGSWRQNIDHIFEEFAF